MRFAQRQSKEQQTIFNHTSFKSPHTASRDEEYQFDQQPRECITNINLQ